VAESFGDFPVAAARTAPIPGNALTTARTLVLPTIGSVLHRSNTCATLTPPEPALTQAKITLSYR
jgi:hypothetical protein